MNTKLLRSLGTSCLLWAVSASGQATFFNLDFESPITPLVPSGSLSEVQATNALPGWTVYLGTHQYDQVRYDQVSIGGAAVSLIDPGYGGGLIEGSYTAVLYPGLSPIAPERASAGIGQTGMIPPNAKSLRFAAYVSAPVGQVDVTFSGQALSLVPLGAGPNGSIQFGADISAFANQPGDLRFTAPPLSGFANPIFLDAIEFSPVAVPEPSIFALLAAGVSLLARRFMRGRQRQ